MARAAFRACATPGCGQLVPAGQRLCRGPGSCQETADRERPGTVERGYGADHRRRRARAARDVARGGASCWRCGTPIPPGTPWQLGHGDDRSEYKGVECVPCNAGDGGRKGLAARA